MNTATESALHRRQLTVVEFRLGPCCVGRLLVCSPSSVSPVNAQGGVSRGGGEGRIEEETKPAGVVLGTSRHVIAQRVRLCPLPIGHLVGIRADAWIVGSAYKDVIVFVFDEVAVYGEVICFLEDRRERDVEAHFFGQPAECSVPRRFSRAGMAAARV